MSCCQLPTRPTGPQQLLNPAYPGSGLLRGSEPGRWHILAEHPLTDPAQCRPDGGAAAMRSGGCLPYSIDRPKVKVEYVVRLLPHAQIGDAQLPVRRNCCFHEPVGECAQPRYRAGRCLFCQQVAAACVGCPTQWAFSVQHRHIGFVKDRVCGVIGNGHHPPKQSLERRGCYEHPLGQNSVFAQGSAGLLLNQLLCHKTQPRYSVENIRPNKFQRSPRAASLTRQAASTPMISGNVYAGSMMNMLPSPKG